MCFLGWVRSVNLHHCFPTRRSAYTHDLNRAMNNVLLIIIGNLLYRFTAWILHRYPEGASITACGLSCLKNNHVILCCYANHTANPQALFHFDV